MSQWVCSQAKIRGLLERIARTNPHRHCKILGCGNCDAPKVKVIITMPHGSTDPEDECEIEVCVVWKDGHISIVEACNPKDYVFTDIRKAFDPN